MAVIHFQDAARRIRNQQPTIGDLIPAWSRDRAADGRQPSGVASYADVARRFIQFAGDVPPANITVEVIKDYKRDLMVRVCPGTARHALTVVRALCAWCVVEGYMPENVALFVPHPLVEPPNPDPLTADEITALFRALDMPQRSHKTTWRRNRRAVCLMIYGGLRISEAVGVLWGDIDMVRREITIRREVAKGGRPRVVPICDELYTELLASPYRNPLYHVVDQGEARPLRGKPLTPKSLAHLFERWLPTRGVHIHAHQLRKTFATELYLRGEDLATIQRLLGHADPKTTMRYIGASSQKERAAVQKLTLRSERKRKKKPSN